MNIDQLIVDLLSDKNSIYNGDVKWNNESLNSSLKKEITDISLNLGVELLNENSFENLMWDGKYLRCQTMTIANILHDFAHFQIALDHNRYLKDFGLSIGPDSNFKIEVPEIPMRDCKLHQQNKLFDNWISYSNLFSTHGLQEIFASVLGILWCRKLKINTQKILIEHDWCYIKNNTLLDEYYESVKIDDINFIFDDISRFESVIEDLKNNDFIDNNFYPMYTLNH